jgi:TRAP-type mannitol/chloroaromatic compound transport system permease large subunit
MKQQTISTFHVTALVVLPLIAEEWEFLVFYFVNGEVYNTL